MHRASIGKEWFYLERNYFRRKSPKSKWAYYCSLKEGCKEFRVEESTFIWCQNWDNHQEPATKWQHGGGSQPQSSHPVWWRRLTGVEQVAEDPSEFWKWSSRSADRPWLLSAHPCSNVKQAHLFLSLLQWKAVDAILPPQDAGEAKTADARVQVSSTVAAGFGNGITHAAVGQPASIAAIKVGEFPCCIQLSNLGNCRSITAASLRCFLEVHVAPNEVDPTWAGEEKGGKIIGNQNLR